MQAELLVLSGEQKDEIISLLPYMSEHEKRVVLSTYPELMGFLPLIVGGLVSLVGSGITAYSSYKSNKNASKVNAEVEKQRLALQAEQEKAAQILKEAKDRRDASYKQYALIGGIALTGIVMVVILKSNSRKR